MARPMLDDLELQLVQKIDTADDQILAQHSIPALEGDFLQGLGRRATSVTLTGVIVGTEAKEGLKTLRDKFKAAEPVSFVADIATATKVTQVIIEQMGVRELAGKPERFEYALTLREYISPPPPKREDPPPAPPPPPPAPPSVDTGTIVVEVIVEGQPNFDFSTITVTLEGTQEDGTALSRSLTNRVDNVWTEENLPLGQYMVKAIATAPSPMSGTVSATIRGGQTTQVTITLRPGVLIAKAFVVHFRFDSAFIEPCLRQVLQQVADYAQAHPQEKLLILGHTDKVGDDLYNQYLSERRARSVYAYLTFGRDRATSTAEWDELRKPAAGSNRQTKDNWSVREYQFILQDLGYYLGNIDEIPGTKTNAAVRAFQQDKGLPATGFVDDATWSALVAAYMESDSLEIPESSFFANAKDSCDGGIVKWLGAGEQDPVKKTAAAWRPNRRTEMLFIAAENIPCDDIPQPRTFNLPTPGAFGSSWCLGSDPGNKQESQIKRVCFLTRESAEDGKWLVQPAEADKINVSGSITFEDGTPVVNAKYVLIAPDGEYLDGESAQGRPIPKRADEFGNFSYPEPKLVGTYILEILDLQDPTLARLRSEPPFEAKGSIVCQRLETSPEPPLPLVQTLTFVARVDGDANGTTGFGAIIQPGPVAPPPVDPIITPASNAVVVSKSYTNPARVLITLSTSSRFRRSGILDRSGNIGAIRLFTAATGGSEITFNSTDNVFSGSRLTTGVRLFAESSTASTNLNDYTLTLTLAPGATPVGVPATATFTAVSLTLDICASRPAPATPPPPLPQPPATPPAPGTATDKWFGGRLINAQDVGNSQERALLIVRQVQPGAFVGDLVLRQVRVTGNNIGSLSNQAQVFDNEIPGPRQTPPIVEVPKANPFVFNTGAILTNGLELQIEGRNVSTALRDIGFQLGINGVENDGDRVSVTVGVGAVISVDSPIVVVKKPQTNPARRVITLRTSVPFTGTGTLIRSASGPPVRLFDSPQNGNEIIITGAGSTFTGNQLRNGVKLFAESIVFSGAVDDYQLTLTLNSPSTIVGAPTTVKMTAVELTLDVGLIRPAPGVDPPLLSANDKVNTGRFVSLRDPGFNHDRALIIIRPPNPLVSITVVLSTINGQLQAFGFEEPAANQPSQPDPLTLPSSIIPVDGFRLFVEGTSASSTLRNTGFRLGIDGLENEADRVAMTVLGDPSQPGPFPVGEFEYTRANPLFIPQITETFSELTFVEIKESVPPAQQPNVPRSITTSPFQVNIRALVRYPAQTAGVNQPVSTIFAQYPLIVIAHGNHGVLDSSGNPVESFRGLEYLARHLASYGYIAISIDLDVVNLPSQRFPAIVQRGLTILEHISLWGTFNTSQPLFTGKVDLSQIALIGHSRGGEAVVSAQKTNIDDNRGHQIKAVVSIAPTDFLGIVHSTTPYLVIYGSADGDVSTGHGFRLYDRANPLKSMIFVYGAIHNRFSTSPDWLARLDSSDTRRLSEADHLNIAKGYCLGLFDFLLRKRKVHEALFKKNGRPPAVSSALELHHQVQDPTKLVVDNFEQGVLNRNNPLPPQLATRAQTNSLGQTVTTTGLAVPTGLTDARTEASLQHRDLSSFWHDTLGAMLAWDATGGRYITTLGNANVSSFQVLSLRVAQRFDSSRNPNPAGLAPGAPQDFFVTLVDSANQSATVQLGAIANIPFPYKRSDDITLTKSALKTIRIPLSGFTDINSSFNLNSVQSVVFELRQTATGEVAIDDIEFSI